MQNNATTRLNPFLQTLALASLFLLLFVSSCQKIDDLPTPGKPTDSTTSKLPDRFFVTSIIGIEKDLGLLVNDRIGGVQYTAYGHKKQNGKLDSIRFIIQNNPNTGDWLAHELNDDGGIKSTTTSTGQTIEYTNFAAGLSLHYNRPSEMRIDWI